MAEEDSKNIDLGDSSSGNIFPSGKPSFSDKECDNDAYRESFSSGKNVQHSSRFSTGMPSSPMSNQKIIPHYQMASTGSCHDLCKYGLKHDFEEKEKRPWKMKKVMLTSSGKHNYVGTVASAELKKSTLPRSLSCPINISRFSQHETSSDAINSPRRPHKIIKGEMMKPCILIEVSSVPKNMKRITDGSGEQSHVTRQPTSNDCTQSGHNTHKAEKKLNRSSQKVSPPLHSPRVKSGLSSSFARPQPVKSRLSSIKETAAISKEALKSSKIKLSKLPLSIQTSGGVNGINKTRDVVLTRKNMDSVSSSSKKRLASPGSSLSSRPSIGRKFVGSLKLVSSLKDQNRMLKKVIRKTSDEHVPEKTLHVVEIETKPKLSESTEVKDIIPPLPPQSNLSLVLPSLQVMSLSSHDEVDEVEKEVVVDENDIHMEDEIKLGAEEEEEEEHTDEHEVEQKEDEVEQEEEEEKEDEEEDEEEQQLEEEEEMEGGDDDDDDDDDDDNDDDDYEEEENVHESDGDESIISNKTNNSDDMKAVEGNMRKPLRKRDAISDSGDFVQVFRRGKVLDIHSENETPRRLRFRQARIMEENHGSKNQISRRNFKRRYSSKANSNNTSDQNIVLRHQDLQEKKDDQGLSLNNVIGETASRLVESRKSKVKALVGAFETVISRHDRKPSAQLAA